MVNKLKDFWKSHDTKIAFVILLVVFSSYCLFLALNLKPGLIPDEPAHFVFSKHFSTTLGIPPDTFETYSLGWYIEQNPFLYYWINGRIINLINFIYPKATDFELLISLRLFSVIYAMGIVVFCLLLSKEVIQHKWWQLLPIFLLTNTLMFVFISAGVTYDNLANLFCMAGIYFLVRVLKNKHFQRNSLGWMISISLGTLVKYTILPLALAMSLSWLVYLIRCRRKIFPIMIKGVKTITLSIIFVSLLIGNFLIYGINLIQYQSLTPPCREILLETQCDLSVYNQRHEEMALDKKLTIPESVSQGYPTPLRYIFVDWPYHLLLRSFGLSGHKAYFPYHLISYYQILFYWMAILGLFSLIFWGSPSFIGLNLIGITAFYALILLFKDYNSELVYGFRQVAVQGRYFFPVIGPMYVLCTQLIKRTPIRILQVFTLLLTLGLFFYGGPLTLLSGYHTILSDWFL